MPDCARGNTESSRAGTLGLVLISLLLLSGCATAPLGSARASFYRGDLEKAELALATIPSDDTDRLLVQMERGMIRQVRHDYDGSVKDWMEAAALGDKLDYYSLTRGAASFAVNDQVMAFRGTPFERTLMHAFAAKSFLALSLWDDAAVEARNIIARLENLYGFPDDAYCHYLAGFCLEMAGDPEGAAFQYRYLSRTMKALAIDEYTGHIGPATTNTPATTGSGPPGPQAPRGACELVCFVSIGRIPALAQSRPGSALLRAAPYAEIYSHDVYLGRTYPFSSTGRLSAETQERLAALKLLKTATRIVAKEAVAEVVSQENELLGEILRLILFAMEVPDTRQWETLPEWLEIGRMTCPDDLKDLRIVFKNSAGRTIRETIMNEPLTRRGKTFVSFCRDL